MISLLHAPQASLGYGQGKGGTACIKPLGQLWLALRCVVDVCGGSCSYSVKLDALPFELSDEAQVAAPLSSDSWHYFRLPLGDFDTLELTLERLADRGDTPDYRLITISPAPPPAPFGPPPLLPPPLAPNVTLYPPNVTAVANATDVHTRRRLASAATSAAVAVARARLNTSEHGLVGSAFLTLGACPTRGVHDSEAAVGVGVPTASARTFCTDASQAGTLYIGVFALAEMNNFSLPTRHWYRISLAHAVFDQSELESGETRLGCLAYGQWRRYRIYTSGIDDARVEVGVDIAVTALYARQGAPPTLNEYDAHAAWPLRTLSLTQCAPPLVTLAPTTIPEAAAHLLHSYPLGRQAMWR